MESYQFIKLKKPKKAGKPKLETKIVHGKKVKVKVYPAQKSISDQFVWGESCKFSW